MENRIIKITLLSPLPPPIGGIANWSINFLEKASSAGFNFDVISTSVIGSRKKTILQGKISS